MLQRFRGLFYYGCIFIASLTGSIFLMGTAMPLAFFPATYKLHRRIVDRVLGAWFLLCTAFLELVMGMKFRLTGDVMKRGETSLYIMNHRTRLDWMWYWPVLYHYARLRKLKIVLKSSLKWIPGFGWAMQQGGFIFLNRNINDDRKNMEDLLEYYDSVGHPVELLIFPEGTDFCPKAIDASNRFAKKAGKQAYNYCLHPRKTGFQVLTSQLLKNEQIKYVQDITIGYPKGAVSNEMDMILRGKFPEEVHFHIEKFKVQDLPHDWEGLGDWVESRFEEKEAKLQAFYEKPETQRIFDKFDHSENYEPRTIGMYLSLVLWPALTMLWIKLCLISSSFAFYQLFITVFYAVQPWWFGGFDFLMAVFGKLFRAKKKSV